MEISLVLTNDSGSYQAILGQFIATSIAETAADRAAADADAASALASATSAAASATSATNSASTATTQAGIATTQAGNAATSATAASGSASAASTSAGNASTSATNAANSATAAAGSASAAATSASNAAATLANALVKANNLSDVASASTARTNLGLGTAATQNTGTSGAAVPLLNGANTWAALQTHSVRPVFNGQTPYDTANLNPFSLMGRNRIINGAANVAQRASVAITGALSYGGPDRFSGFIFGAGGGFTQSQGTITYGSVARNAVVQTVTTAATSIASGNGWNGIAQTIEGFNSYDLKGQPVAVSFIFSTNVTGNYALALRDNPNNNSFVTTFAATAATPVYVSVAVPTLPTSLSIPASNAAGLSLNIGALNTGTYQASTLNSWQAFNGISAAGCVNWAATAGNFIAVTDLQVEAGSIATPFERRSYGFELELCQRYYSISTFRIDIPVSSANTLASTTVAFPASMRAAPTCALANMVYTGSAAAGNFNSFQGGGTPTSGTSPVFATQSTIGSANGSVIANSEF